MNLQFKKYLPLLKNICAMNINDFKAYGFEYQTDDNRRFFFMDNDADILAVAHLDTVQTQNFCRYDKKTQLIHSPVLDDRLGAFIILEYMLRDLDYDVLLTVDEEKGRSSASQFKTDKKYNWMFSFDRKGSDVVMYQYETPEMKNLLTNNGFKIGVGSYSDICELEHLGCKGFNFGTGYYNGHSVDAYANLSEVYRNVEKFKQFYAANRNTHLNHGKVKR